MIFAFIVILYNMADYLNPVIASGGSADGQPAFFFLEQNLDILDMSIANLNSEGREK